MLLLCIVNLAPHYASSIPLLPSETRRFKRYTMVSVTTYFLVVLIAPLLCLILILYHLTWPVFFSLSHGMVANHKETGIILSYSLVAVVESSNKNKEGGISHVGSQFPREKVHSGGEYMVQEGKAGGYVHEPGWTHGIHTQEAEHIRK